MSEACAGRDLVGRRIGWLLWGAPIVAVVLGTGVGPFARMLIWAPAFLVMGGACVVNAARCGRLHCYVTAPLFLAAALGSVLVGLDVLPLSWAWIGSGVLIGTVLAHIPEWVRGKHVAAAVGSRG